MCFFLGKVVGVVRRSGVFELTIPPFSALFPKPKGGIVRSKILLKDSRQTFAKTQPKKFFGPVKGLAAVLFAGTI